MRWILKLGVAYNTFSGVELLKPAILNIRELASFIVVVYSERSITGEPAPEFLMPVLNDLCKEGLVDKIISVSHPVTKEPLLIQNEKRKKYELGRWTCFHAGCTHFMGRDVDEFFETEQLEEAMLLFGDEDAVLCPLFDYIRSPNYKARHVNTLYVSAFQKIDLTYAPVRTPVLLDMSRTVNAKNFYVTTQDQLVMHHMTGVRYNAKEVERKFQGHSHFLGIGRNEKSRYSVIDDGVYKTVDDQFGILKYWEKEFVEYYG